MGQPLELDKFRGFGQSEHVLRVKCRFAVTAVIAWCDLQAVRRYFLDTTAFSHGPDIPDPNPPSYIFSRSVLESKTTPGLGLGLLRYRARNGISLFRVSAGSGNPWDVRV
ncbi:hypothetical protein CIHG_01317 [Coccidioides immitis H538.4]|uniref:Uncharacterized protein n=3 Tax=Coccidioides immitis TaxID=5501 RepID=A0A0J8QJZ7_COCIT|nr:hypothetical protein CIRG_01162 [Coccidioides immitis RMSCC 2394]KMU72739.1 hypothetical protein CISG_03173 [Coccidioides immitis RMSCC 3703]KMU83534.1 hypothetical protein CIHG_01317 [Coccidioides immitis H538.4]